MDGSAEESDMKFFVAGMSYRTTPVEVREQLAVPHSRLECAGCWLKLQSGLSEVVVLSTCNRVEIYGVTERRDNHLAGVFQHLPGCPPDVGPYTYLCQGEAAARHLFAVASGLDSMVLGETEITGQVKHAYEAARAARLTGRVLNRLFQKALQAAKEIRTLTSVGRGATSVGSVAVELAEKIFGADLTRRTIMIIGAGKMGEACVRHLAKKAARSVLVSNRSFERAEALARQFAGRAVRMEECSAALVEADIVVSSTGCPDMVLHRAQVEAALRGRGGRPLVLIDIAVPRDIDPGVQTLDNVYLYNIDDLEAVVREHVRMRDQEAGKCHALINERAAELIAKLTAVSEQPYDPRIQPQLGWLFCRAAAGGG